MGSLNIEESEMLSFIRANGCVTLRDICNVSYMDETAVRRQLDRLIGLKLVCETVEGNIKPLDQFAAEE